MVDIEVRTQRDVCSDFGRTRKGPEWIKGSLLGERKFFPELYM